MSGISTSAFYGREKVDSSLTEAERILKRIVEGDSDIDLSENDSPFSQTGEGEDSDEEPDEEDQDAQPDDTEPAEVCRHPIWAKTNRRHEMEQLGFQLFLGQWQRLLKSCNVNVLNCSKF